MENDVNFVQTLWATAGALGEGRCVWCAPRPQEMKEDPCTEGFELLGEPAKKKEKDGIQKVMDTQI